MNEKKGKKSAIEKKKKAQSKNLLPCRFQFRRGQPLAFCRGRRQQRIADPLSSAPSPSFRIADDDAFAADDYDDALLSFAFASSSSFAFAFAAFAFAAADASRIADDDDNDDDADGGEIAFVPLSFIFFPAVAAGVDAAADDNNDDNADDFAPVVAFVPPAAVAGADDAADNNDPASCICSIAADLI